MNYLMIAGSSACVYIFIVVAIRLFGKEELAQLSITDLVFILLISNAVQNAMVGSDTSLLGGLCAAATLFIINYALKYVLYRFPKISTFIQGDAIMLIYEGQVIKENLIKARVSRVEIEEAAREHGIKSIEDINLAVLEMDGNISVLANNYTNKIKRKKKHYKDLV